MSGATWHRAAALEDFRTERKQRREVAGIDMLLCRIETQIFAFRNSCTHLGETLDKGRMMAGQIHCPYHGACFDIRTGKAMSGPAIAPLKTFDVEIRGGDVFVLV